MPIHACLPDPCILCLGFVSCLQGFTETMANATLNAATAIEAARNAYGDVAKLAIGTVVGDMRTRMQSMVSTPGSRPRFVLYSAHDSTLFPLLSGCWGGEGGLSACHLLLTKHRIFSTPSQSLVQSA